MRTPVARNMLVAAVALTLPLTLIAVAGSAAADEHKPIPTQSQVDAASARAAADAHSVAAIRASLAAANSRLQDAANAAEIASEDYNGAMWRLSVARQTLTKATAAAAAAKAKVTAQRAGIGALVAKSAQEGQALNSVTALLTDEGPEGVMNRYGAFQSADASLEAKYEAFKKLNTLARVYQAKAAAAKTQSEELAAQAKSARDAAAASAQAAADEQASISRQRNQLIARLATAENVSVRIAKQRQDGLEALARKRAEEARAAKARAAARAAARRAAAEKAAAAKAKREHHDAPVSSASPSDPPADPPTNNPPPVSGSAAQRAIAFAKAQLGDPYVWAAAGPNTWDCSGLTMMAWRQGGVSLPHYSVAQYDAGTPIAISDAQPGDLLFWSSNGRPSGIHHVAIYLGGGSFIEAPHTGADVRYDSIYEWYPNFAVRL